MPSSLFLQLVIARSAATKQSTTQCIGPGLLRFARNDGEGSISDIRCNGIRPDAIRCGPACQGGFCGQEDTWRRARGEPRQHDGARVLQSVLSLRLSVAELAVFRGRKD